MAKAPNQRRGITLGARADSATVLERLTAQPVPSGTTSSDPIRAAPGIGGQPEGSVVPMSVPLDELRRLHAGLEGRWRQQAEQIERQLSDLAQQHAHLARQTHELQVLVQRRDASRRERSLLALLALAGVAALGVHGWPWLRGIEQDFNRLSAGVAALAPQLQAVREQVIALGSDRGPGESAMASLQEDVEGVRSDLSSLRQAVDTLSEAQNAFAAGTGARESTANPRPHNATTMTNPYRTAPPFMPW